jgi:hypothetical protein
MRPAAPRADDCKNDLLSNIFEFVLFIEFTIILLINDQMTKIALYYKKTSEEIQFMPSVLLFVFF